MKKNIENVILLIMILKWKKILERIGLK